MLVVWEMASREHVLSIRSHHPVRVRKHKWAIGGHTLSKRLIVDLGKHMDEPLRSQSRVQGLSWSISHDESKFGQASSRAVVNFIQSDLVKKVTDKLINVRHEYTTCLCSLILKLW